MTFSPKKTQKGLAIERLAQTLSVAERVKEPRDARRESSLLANSGAGAGNSFYSTCKPRASGGFGATGGEPPLSMWDKMTLFDLQKKQAEDLACSQSTKARQ
jgi:hypothetical protein